MWDEIRSRHPERRRSEWATVALDVAIMATLAWLALALVALGLASLV